MKTEYLQKSGLLIFYTLATKFNYRRRILSYQINK